MNILEKSNEKSILQTLLRPLSTNPFIYSYNFNVADGIKWCEYVYPRFENSPTYGDIIYFDLPRNGLLSRLILETTVSSTLDNTVYQDNIGERIFEWIDLQTVAGSRSIQKTTSEYISLRTSQLDDSTNSRMSILMNPDPSLDTINTFSIVYTPFYGYFSEHPKKFIDTKKVEDLQLVVKIAPSYTFMGFQNALTGLSFRLHATYFTTVTDTPVPRSMLTLHEFQEPTKVISTGSTSTSIFLTANRSIHSTHFLLKSAEQDLFNFNSVQFKVDGKSFYDTTKRLALLDYGIYEKAGYEIDNIRPSQNLGNRFLSIYWSLYGDRNHNTLCIDFTNLGAVEVTLTFDALDGDYTLYTIHEFWDIIDINEGGEIMRSYIH